MEKLYHFLSTKCLQSRREESIFPSSTFLATSRTNLISGIFPILALVPEIPLSVPWFLLRRVAISKASRRPCGSSVSRTIVNFAPILSPSYPSNVTGRSPVVKIFFWIVGGNVAKSRAPRHLRRAPTRQREKGQQVPCVLFYTCFRKSLNKW